VRVDAGGPAEPGRGSAAPGGGSAEPTTTGVRLGVLGVSVLFDLDLMPLPDGSVELTGPPSTVVSWADLVRCLGGADPESQSGRDRLAEWLLARRWLADVATADLVERVRPVGMPVSSPLHPGPGWARARVRGGVLDLGVGFLGLRPGRPDDVVVVAPAVLAGAGFDPTPCWPGALDYLEEMGQRAVERWQRNLGDAIRPMGDCDVVTLLASRTLRGQLAAAHAGLCPAAVPMRTRGWLDLRRIDPAFALAAAAATDEPARGFDRVVMLTRDEVFLARDGGRAAGELALRDPAVDRPWWQGVDYH
jgi:hypothetical protein